MNTCKSGILHTYLLFNPVLSLILELKNHIHKQYIEISSSAVGYLVENLGLDPIFRRSPTPFFFIHNGWLPWQLQHVIIMIIPCLPKPFYERQNAVQSMQPISLYAHEVSICTFSLIGSQMHILH